MTLDQVPRQVGGDECAGQRHRNERDETPPVEAKAGEQLLPDEAVDVDAIGVVVLPPDPVKLPRHPYREPDKQVGEGREAEDEETAKHQGADGDDRRPKAESVVDRDALPVQVDHGAKEKEEPEVDDPQEGQPTEQRYDNGTVVPRYRSVPTRRSPVVHRDESVRREREEQYEPSRAP